LISGVEAAGGDVLRHAERRLRRRGPPRLHPRHPAALELADDFVRDFAIEVCPVRAGGGRSSLSGHRGSPRRAPRASLAASNPSRITQPISHSSAAARALEPARPCSQWGLHPRRRWRLRRQDQIRRVLIAVCVFVALWASTQKPCSTELLFVGRWSGLWVGSFPVRRQLSLSVRLAMERQPCCRPRSWWIPALTAPAEGETPAEVQIATSSTAVCRHLIRR
jgi:hypothetical protein